MEGRNVIGWAARDSSGHLSPYIFNLRKTGAEDVVLKVLYSGADHTDLHQVRGEIGYTHYPLVPGHEVVGEVVELGRGVRKFKVGDIVGVGCIIWSCEECSSCNSKMEQYCDERIPTYNALNKDGSITQGGYSTAMVVDQRFVVRIPEKLAAEQAAPLLCAGVTAYSPLKGLNKSHKAQKVGILGLGGVGHLGVLIAKAMGHHVTVISSSEKKREEALEHLGADAFLVSSNADEMKNAAKSLDYILDTVPAVHSLNPYLSLLKVDGQITIVGAAAEPLQFTASDLILEETREILEFWAEKGLTRMIEVVKMDQVNKAFERTEKNDVRYRFVLDVASSNIE